MSSGMGDAMGFQKPSKLLIWVVGVNVAAYVLYLLLLRAGMVWVQDLRLTPASVFESGYIWQPFSYLLLHAPQSPGHLLWNMLLLYMFAGPLESWWGPRRFLSAYLIFGLSGAFLIMFMGGLGHAGFMSSFLGTLYQSPHLGASASVMGMMTAWGIVHANRRMNFFLLGAMNGMTFVLIIIGIELLRALSFDNVSSAAHFGGIAGAFVVCKGLWRPSQLRRLFHLLSLKVGRGRASVNEAALKRKRREMEKKLRVIRGGKSDDDDDKMKWN
jgi:membrane associated rhomboid family serine protease